MIQKLNKTYVLALAFLCFSTLLSAQTTIYSNDFESCENSYSEFGAFSDGGSDYFMRTSGSADDTNCVSVATGTSGDVTYSNVSGLYYTAEDVDRPAENPNTTGEFGSTALTSGVHFNDINVSGFTNVQIVCSFASSVNMSYENGDYIRIYVDKTNNGTYELLGAFESTNGGGNTTLSQDTDLDGSGDGAVLSAAFQSFTFDVEGATTMDVRIEVLSSGSSEEMAFDTFLVEGGIASSPLTASISAQNNVSCNGGNNGSLTVTATDGQADYTYSWSNGEDTTTSSLVDSIIGLTAGTYSVIVSDANGDSITLSATITEPTALSINFNANGVSCDGDTDGSISASVSGGTSPYSYLWSNGDDTSSINGIGAGTYTLTVTDLNGCSIIDSATVTVEDTIAPTANAQNITVYLDGSGNTNITAADVDNGSTDNCSVSSLSIDQDSFDCTNLGANSVLLIVNDNAANSDSASFIVTVLDSLAPVVSTQNIVAYLDGSGNASISTGDIDNGTSDNCSISSLSLDVSSFNASMLGGNTVNLTATDNSGNSASKSATVIVLDSNATTSIAIQENFETCQGNYSEYGAYTDGSSDYFIRTNGTDEDTNCAPSVTSGDITFTNTDGFYYTAEDNDRPLENPNTTGEFGSDPFTSGVHFNDIDVSGFTTVKLSCSFAATTASAFENGDYVRIYIDKTNNGIYELFAAFETQNGLGNDSLSLDTDLDGSGDGTILTEAFQSFDFYVDGATVMDVRIQVLSSAGNEEIAFDSFIVEGSNAADPLSVSITSQTNVFCNGDATASLTATVEGGQGDFSYLWDNGDTTLATSSTTNSINGLAAGNYTLTVVDSNGDSASTSAVVTEPSALNLSIDLAANASCSASADGSLASSVTGGTAPYSYSWSNGDITDSLNNVSAGTYVLTVTDINGCSVADSATIIVSDTIAPNAMASDITVYLDASGNASIIAADVDNGSNDNCGIASLSVSPSTFDCSDVVGDNSLSVVSDSTWTESTVIDSTTALQFPWSGAPYLPSTSSYTQDAEPGQPYSWVSIQPIPGTQVIKAGAYIRFYRKTFMLSSFDDLSARIRMSVDDDMEIYINGKLMAGEYSFAQSNFKGNPHDLLIDSTGTTNGYNGGDAFDAVTTESLDSLFVIGENEIVLAVRNGIGNNRGGFTFAMDIHADFGGNPVTLTVTDVNGNVSKAMAVVTVKDTVAPQINSLPSSFSVFTSGGSSVPAYWLLPTASDVCGVQSLSKTHHPGDHFVVGTTAVTYTALDINGNSTSSSFNVTVSDTSASASIANNSAGINTSSFNPDEVAGEVNFTLTDLYPNPIESGQTLVLGLESEGLTQTEIYIYSSTGHLIRKNTITVNKGINTVEINPGVLGSGTYFIKVGKQLRANPFIVR